MSRRQFLATLPPTSACIDWPGATNNKGYGSVTNGRGGSALAHRVAYELHVGTIPPGLTIDHLCRNKTCVNPRHMEPVTIAENNRRAMPTECPRGHAFTADNVYWKKFGADVRRQCRRCTRVRAKAFARGITAAEVTDDLFLELEQTDARRSTRPEPSKAAS